MSKIEGGNRLPKIKDNRKSRNVQHSYAPFLSTESKSPVLKNGKSPGPAHYNKQAIEKQQKYYSSITTPQKYQSAISRQQNQQSRSSSLQKDSNSDSPQSLHKHYKKHVPNSLQYYRIKFPHMSLHNQSVSVHNKVQNQNVSLNNNKSMNKQSKGTMWSKYKQQRFKQKKHEDSPGPGSYHDSIIQRRKPNNGYYSPQFVSGSDRSFMDSIIYETNANKNVPLTIYKNDEPGPGSYNIQSQFDSKRNIQHQQRTISLRKRKVHIGNLSAFISKNSSKKNIEPLLHIRQINQQSQQKTK